MRGGATYKDEPQEEAAGVQRSVYVSPGVFFSDPLSAHLYDHMSFSLSEKNVAQTDTCNFIQTEKYTIRALFRSTCFQ